ncbi:MAG: asparagine synthase (glutamine-hydrolyzing) [Desulfatitalea sp.]|nr:asparagine synthase (glutamine-hydrolyzing) [Desulfatitalea sp.]NNK00987.1 asparagine synthase (glutamine-hydrolyzing) [Desulfatitalea sp.]
MCGIVGIAHFGQKGHHETILNRMLLAMRHRGPDATGLYLSDEVGLGHARLSIIDINGGHQPIHNEDRTVWVIFNGEIFNYPELRNDLIQRGHRFYTQSDTEVIVHLYEEYGAGMFSRLNGQFAIALWDVRKRCLLLGRDRIGIRPFFYHQKGSRLTFASEIKALFTDPQVPRQLDPQTLSDVFTCWTPVDPLTAFKGVAQLPPGHYAVWNNSGMHIERYWQLNFDEADAGQRPFDAWAEEIQALILDAARIRLRADVPVGAYLSGGIDSTYISTLVKNNFNNHLNTFSVQFEDKRFDETQFQQTALSVIQTQHRAIQCADIDIGRIFPKVVWHAEVPMIRSAPAPLMLLSGLVRRSDFKVVLTGEGADEIFGGYDIFKEAQIRRFWARQPNSALRPLLLKKLYPDIFDQKSGRPNAFLIGFFKHNLTMTDSPVYSHLVRWRNTSQLKKFFSHDLGAGSDDLDQFSRRITGKLPDRFAQWSPLAQAQYLESCLFLSNYLLSTQGDRMTMANSIEGRYPFLDHRVMEAAARLPAKFRLNGLTEKYLLKRIAKNQVPDEVIRRAKQPYRAPISHSFMSAQAPDYVFELLSEAALKKTGYFDPPKVQRLLAKCRQHGGRLVSERENMALVAILSTQLLDQQFVQAFPSYPDKSLTHAVFERQATIPS